jgi:hypothetical protein
MPTLPRVHLKTSNTHNFWTVATKIMKFALMRSLFWDASSEKVSKKILKIVWDHTTQPRIGLSLVGTSRPLGVKCCITMVLILVSVVSIRLFLYLYLSLSLFNDGIWVVPRAPIEITIKGGVFQLQALISSIRDWYLIIFALIFSSGYLSLVCVNSMIWITRDGSNVVGGILWCSSPSLLAPMFPQHLLFPLYH